MFNLGHGVLPETDPGVLEQVVELVHAEGRAGVGGPLSGPPTRCVGVLVMAHGTPDTPEEIEAFYTRIRTGPAADARAAGRAAPAATRPSAAPRR